MKPSHLSTKISQPINYSEFVSMSKNIFYFRNICLNLLFIYTYSTIDTLSSPTTVCDDNIVSDSSYDENETTSQINKSMV